MDIGGTNAKKMAATPMSSNNIVSIQSPGSMGGSNMTFDFGPNVATLSDSAYNFLNASFQNDRNFVGAAISGSQGFYSSLVKPATDAATAQIQKNNELLPSLYTSLLDTTKLAMSISQSIANTSMSTSAAIAGNTVREQSRVARRTGKPKGFCFITTACCDYYGLSDDCEMLQTLRKFRDDYMLPDDSMRLLVDNYYLIAPNLVEKIKARENSREIFENIREVYLDQAVIQIHDNDFRGALLTYQSMVDYVIEAAHE